MHGEGKNESMLRRETRYNRSLPLSSWFPDLTVFILTFLALTARPVSPRIQNHSQTLSHSYEDRIIHHSLMGVHTCVSTHTHGPHIHTHTNTHTQRVRSVMFYHPCCRVHQMNLRRVHHILGPLRSQHLRFHLRKKGSRQCAELPQGSGENIGVQP